MASDELYMLRTFKLAHMGLGQVSPNPMVGCVIVHQDTMISEGWHTHFGAPHAEVMAIHQVPNQHLLSESTLYVNLEPCNHVGKTPPCVDLIIEKKINRVVISNIDSNPSVAGHGIETLNQAGIAVTVGVLEDAGRQLNKRFFTAMEKKRPYIILKWAQTKDGLIAQKNYESKWISGELARQRVHKMRSEEDAVMVGTRTALHDNPQLSVRQWTGRNPTRVVLDRFLRLPDTLQFFDGTQPTLCFNVIKHEEHGTTKRIRVDEANFIEQVVASLYNRGLHSLMVEGGSITLQSLIDHKLWDEAHIVTSRKTFGKGIAAPTLHGQLESSEKIGDDEWSVWKPAR